MTGCLQFFQSFGSIGQADWELLGGRTWTEQEAEKTKAGDVKVR